MSDPDAKLRTLLDHKLLCLECRKDLSDVEPYMMGGSPEPPYVEAYCSPECWTANNDPDRDSDVQAGVECGRWRNGRLRQQCTKAGSEECDWECPYGTACVSREGDW